MNETRNIYGIEGFPGLMEAIAHVGFPCKVKITSGADRSLDQNRLQFLWCKEAAEQLKEYTADEYRAYCKLHFAVPIMREDDHFRAEYDRVVKPMSYEDKLKIMGEPLCLPVTRLMTVAQKRRYLDCIFDHFTSLGAVLTVPPDTRYE